MDRREFLATTALSLGSAGLTGGATASELLHHRSLIASIETEAIKENRDGSSETWFHPRACMRPGPNGNPIVLMTMQWIRGSDYFGPVQWTTSPDQGRSWTDPQPVEALGRVDVDGHDGLLAGVCDVVPQWHPPTESVLALGHVVFYRGERFSGNDQLARYPVYAVQRRDGSWSERKILEWDDPRGGFIYSNNCGQRIVDHNGDILMAFTFGPESSNRMVAGVRCAFDGDTLTIVEVGEPLHRNVGRGLLEPSVTRFGDKFLMTIRAEDNHGYVATSDDGVQYGEMQPWSWDDGERLEMSTTQQHWLSHSDGLFLVYTRKDASNANVIRWRAPLWIAQVDIERRCLIRESERIALPLVGNGVDDPDGVALMGNFHVVNVSPDESWVTVGEWLPRRQARGNLLLARIRWSVPNSLVTD